MTVIAVGRCKRPFKQPVMTGVFSVSFGVFAVERFRLEAIVEKIKLDVSRNVRLY